MTKKFLSLSIAISMMLPFTVITSDAQGQDPDEEFEEIIVTGTKIRPSLQDIPTAVTTLDPNDPNFFSHPKPLGDPALVETPDAAEALGDALTGLIGEDDLLGGSGDDDVPDWKSRPQVLKDIEEALQEGMSRFLQGYGGAEDVTSGLIYARYPSDDNIRVAIDEGLVYNTTDGGTSFFSGNVRSEEEGSPSYECGIVLEIFSKGQVPASPFYTRDDDSTNPSMFSVQIAPNFPSDSQLRVVSPQSEATISWTIPAQFQTIDRLPPSIDDVQFTASVGVDWNGLPFAGVYQVGTGDVDGNDVFVVVIFIGGVPIGVFNILNLPYFIPGNNPFIFANAAGANQARIQAINGGDGFLLDDRAVSEPRRTETVNVFPRTVRFRSNFPGDSSIPIFADNFEPVDFRNFTVTEP